MRTSRIPLSVLAILSILVAIGSWRFLVLGLDTAFQGAPFDTFLADNRMVFLAHVVAAPSALALGAVQFFPGLRTRSIRRHRMIGRIYGIAVLVGGTSAVILTFQMGDRPGASTGFFLLGTIWIAATANAVLWARRGEISRHQDWMIRSFALTASALTLRLYLGGLTALGYDYYTVSSVLAWVCWLPNLVIAEWLIARNASTEHRLPAT